MAETVAKLNKLDIAPRKTRSVARIIFGMTVGDAEAELSFRKERAARPLLKLLRSAVANAKVKGLYPENLFVKEIRVDKGMRLKRWLPRARGMATPIHKDFSNVIIKLGELKDKTKRSKFIFSSGSSAKAGVAKLKKVSADKDNKEEKAEVKKTPGVTKKPRSSVKKKPAESKIKSKADLGGKKGFLNKVFNKGESN